MDKSSEQQQSSAVYQSSLISDLSTSGVQALSTVRIASGTPFRSSDWHCDWLFVVTTAVEGANAHRAIAHNSMERYTYTELQLEFFLEFSKKVKAVIQDSLLIWAQRLA